MKKIFSFIVIIGILIVALSGCQGKQSLEKVTLTLDWTPNTNHTGVFVAKELGYFKDEGIDIEIIQPGKSTSDQLVAANKAQFGFSYQEGLTFARLQNLPIVSLAAVIQHNTSAFASPKSKGITTPKDFEDKRYAGWGSPVEEAIIKALMDKYSADYKKVNILTTGATDFFATTEKDADFAWIFYGWDGIASKIKNKPLNFIFLKDVDKDLDYYTPIITTNEENIKTNPELVRKVMSAISKGYEYTGTKPVESAEMLLKNAPELDKKLVMDSQKYLSSKYKDDASYWGQQDPEVWRRYSNWLFDRKLIDKELDIENAFTNNFLPKEVK